MDDPQPTGADPVGTLGEEAVKLFSAVSSWAQDHAGAEGQATTAAGHGVVTGSGCQWCPLCRAVSSARAVSPELREQLVVAGLALTTSARTFLESLAAPPGRPNRTATDVEHIDLRDEDGGAQPWD